MDIGSILAGYLIGVICGVLVWSMMVASTLASAHTYGKIVFLGEAALKDYLFVVGVRKKNVEANILYKDSKYTIVDIKHGVLKLFKDLDLDENR